MRKNSQLTKKRIRLDHYSVSNYTLDGFEPISEKFREQLKYTLSDLPFKVIYMF